MSKHMLTLTGISARLKGHNVQITGQFPDNEESIINVPGEDIVTLYGCNPAAFLEAYGDDENTLTELFTAVSGIGISAFAD